jgi:hypothetical protein
MRVVTTCSKEGFDAYGHRVLSGWKHWPKSAELWFYADGFKIPETPGVVQCDTSELWGLQAFKEKYKNYVAPNYLFDVVRFSHKVYAAAGALAGNNGLGIWLDADCVTLQNIPDGYLEGLIGDHYIALFKRKGMYSETGFWMINCDHPQHAEFIDIWLDWYEKDSFRSLSNWTDCETLDATVRLFEKRGTITSVSLSGEFEKHHHPLSFVDLGKYIDHCKGPRKELGYSPENLNSSNRVRG